MIIFRKERSKVKLIKKQIKYKFITSAIEHLPILHCRRVIRFFSFFVPEPRWEPYQDETVLNPYGLNSVRNSVPRSEH